MNVSAYTATARGLVAERYADDAISKLGVWRSRLGGAASMAFSLQEVDMTDEQARQLSAIFQGLTVQGTSSPEETINTGRDGGRRPGLCRPLGVRPRAGTPASAVRTRRPGPDGAQHARQR
jgi:hypothetical protein